MKVLISSMFAVLCVSGCLESDPAGSDNAADEGTQATMDQDTAQVSENLNEKRATDIAKAKMALVGADAISPQAAACGKAGPTSTSERVNDAAFKGAAQQRSGSSTSCTAPGALQPTDDALYFCFTVGNDGFTWTFLQNLRTTVRGWTRDDLLRPPPGATVGGARNWCGF